MVLYIRYKLPNDKAGRDPSKTDFRHFIESLWTLTRLSSVVVVNVDIPLQFAIKAKYLQIAQQILDTYLGGQICKVSKNYQAADSLMIFPLHPSLAFLAWNTINWLPVPFTHPFSSFIYPSFYFSHLLSGAWKTHPSLASMMEGLRDNSKLVIALFFLLIMGPLLPVVCSLMSVLSHHSFLNKSCLCVFALICPCSQTHLASHLQWEFCIYFYTSMYPSIDL